ncbi:NAD(P)/FAD-dependent oxidoreductase [Halomicronema sp. CCY15110]|uniref:NAD(P)/FAD-dependent oxidoreductase n=1 Tax=Halomicronema sp. CCY15110 TaxID=2767773 RepID=UPI00194E5151|nr:NAD(P)/FAD-dependent oxidoreductase [Halomicronema sp. CCY15110]
MAPPSPSTQRDRIVIIGAGFGGFQAAQSLAGATADVLLIDRNNYHTFVPLLYQVATAQLEPSLVAYPVRTKLRGMRNVRFLQAEVKRVDFHHKLVDLGDNLIPYDYLVVATGAAVHDYGVPGVAAHAFTLQSLREALELRNHVLQCCEQAAFITDDRERQRLMTFAIVGGGATGVELAGALAEWLRGAVRRDFSELSDWGRVMLLQAGSSLLPEFPQRLGNYTHRQLEQLGVQVSLNTKVTACSEQDVKLSDQEAIATATVVWAAGVTANPPTLAQPSHQKAKGKLALRETLQLVEHDNVYAIGDVAYFEQSGEPLSGVAPEALQQGVAVARNLRRQLAGDSPRPFRYLNKGRLAIIGGYGGVGSVLGVNFGGWLPWLMWLLVHVVYLPGYRSRLLVLLTWVQNYVMGDRALRQLSAHTDAKH